jgi:ABC-2 type transport system ATP-binding protein
MNVASLAVDVHQLHKKYSLGLFGGKSFHALKGIDLQVRRGEVFGLLGPNGAGKTTLIKILLGIVRGNSGQAQVMDLPAGSKSARRLIGYLPENLNFPSHHTAISALKLFGRLSSVPEPLIVSRSQELLRLVGLEGREKELVKRYSKGMRQRLGLAVALLHDPLLLVMDEPTDGLDPVGRSEIRALIGQLKQRGKTIFLNSHILQEVELICDRVAILAGGLVRGIGTPAELTQQFQSAGTSKLRMELIGAITPIRQAFEPMPAFETLDCLQLPSGNWQVSIAAGAQDELDRLIDRLRLNQIGICKLERTQLTLEEIFLSAVQS